VNVATDLFVPSIYDKYNHFNDVNEVARKKNVAEWGRGICHES